MPSLCTPNLIKTLIASFGFTLVETTALLKVEKPWFILHPKVMMYLLVSEATSLLNHVKR